MLQTPKYKKELRKIINDEVNNCKNADALRIICMTANLFRRTYGTNDEFATLSEAEIEKYYLIRKILHAGDDATTIKRLKVVSAFLNSCLEKSHKEKIS